MLPYREVCSATFANFIRASQASSSFISRQRQRQNQVAVNSTFSFPDGRATKNKFSGISLFFPPIT